MTVARKIPFDDPQVLTYVRIAYVVVQLVVLGAYFVVSQKVCSTLPNVAGNLTHIRVAPRSKPRMTRPFSNMVCHVLHLLLLHVLTPDAS